MIRIAGLVLSFFLVACASKPPAQVEDRSGSAAAASSGYYRVVSGDTLYAIAFSHGLDYRRLASWNGLRAPYTIYPGQNLRLTSPPENRSAKAADASSSARNETRPKATPPPASATTRPAPVPAPKPPTSASSQRTPGTGASSASGSGRWLWPANGRIIRGFSPTDPSRDGIDIAGSEGDPVRASAAGTVVYSGDGLKGYGELIIVKHDDRWLSAYGHNRKRLVAEGEKVNAGQKIAEIGRNDRNEEVLHFEIRSNGRPVNPLDQLPPR